MLVRTCTPVKLFDQLHQFPSGFWTPSRIAPAHSNRIYISHLTAQREMQANFVDARAPPSFRRLFSWMCQMIHYRARHAWTRTQLMADGCRSHTYRIISLHFTHFYLLLSYRSDKIGLNTRDIRTCGPFDLWILLTCRSCFLSTRRSCRERFSSEAEWRFTTGSDRASSVPNQNSEVKDDSQHQRRTQP